MNTNEVDIDGIVNYKSEYSQEIKKNKTTGDELLGLCPFHQDSKPSFTVNLKNGCYECKACGEKGNYITYYAKTRGLSNKDAYKAILANYGVENNWQPESALKYTLKEYSFQKRLPEQFLADNFHITNGVDRRTGRGYIKIPYYGHDQQEVTFRKRYNDPKDKFRWKTGTKINTMYGEWRLKEIQDTGYVIMVEGESDTQTLWYLNFAALGVPGASCVKPEFLDKIEGMRVYIHVEPDLGGQTFLRNMTNKLKDYGFTGQVYQMSCKTHGEKDPSNLYIKYGADEAKKMIQGLIKNAKPIDLEHLNEIIPESVPGFSINLRLPPSWMYSEKGIHHKDEKTQEYSCVCRTPIIISKRIKSMDVGDEKVEIEFKRDGKVQSAIFPRSTIFQAKSITVLSDLGCTITSENAKFVVRFLAALEAENYDIIPSVDSTSTFGWQTKGRFLPGHGDDIVLDIDNSLRSWANAYEVRGDFDKWKETMSPHRERDKFRFILASSFTAPLLKWISQRIFFIYNWGDSKGGKTAGLKAALSAWGDPEKLMVNFNATQVALERMAGFYCDLPLGIDERQLAGNNQGILEKIVYMIASGTGRARGAKGGGLQEMRTWRTVAIATGEEPLNTESSMTGISTRVLELYGGPFTNEKDASMMHQTAGLNCGWAGPYFIEKILEIGSEEIKKRFEIMMAYVHEQANGENGAHTASIAAVALADSLVDQWIFGSTDQEASEERAKAMAVNILEEQRSMNVEDVNENAVQFIMDWIVSNKNNFGLAVQGQCYGFEEGGYVYILPTVLAKALASNHFSPRKTTNYMAENHFLVVDSSGKHSIIKKWNNKVTRFVKLDITEIDKKFNYEPINEFKQVTLDEELPF